MKSDENKKARAIFSIGGKECVFKERDRGHVICSSGADTNYQCNQSNDRQKNRFSQTLIVWTKEKTDMHLISGCPKLAQKQYKRRHDSVARRVNWELRKKVQTVGMSIHLLK